MWGPSTLLVTSDSDSSNSDSSYNDSSNRDSSNHDSIDNSNSVIVVLATSLQFLRCYF